MDKGKHIKGTSPCEIVSCYHHLPGRKTLKRDRLGHVMELIAWERNEIPVPMEMGDTVMPTLRKDSMLESDFSGKPLCL